jgi:hypothetical protein
MKSKGNEFEEMSGYSSHNDNSTEMTSFILLIFAQISNLNVHFQFIYS